MVAKKQTVKDYNRKKTIDAKGKKVIKLIEGDVKTASNSDELNIDELRASFDKLYHIYYANDAMLARIQARTLREIFNAKFNQFIRKSLTTAKKEIN